MDIETSGAIKLFFPNPSLVQIYFEALANSLDAGATKINIQVEISSFDDAKSLRITISDNGSGFTDESFGRFKTLLKPRDDFHKGLGRLIFLNYFDRVEVTSVWDKNRRTFVFKDPFNDDAKPQDLAEKHPQSTKLVFTNFAGERVKSYDDLKPGSLKGRIVEHFLPWFYDLHNRKVEFEITIALTVAESNAQKDFFSGEEKITSADLPDLTLVEIKDPTIDALASINMLYQVKTGVGKGTQLIAINIDGRTIPINLIQSSSVPPARVILNQSLLAGSIVWFLAILNQCGRDLNVLPQIKVPWNPNLTLVGEPYLDLMAISGYAALYTDLHHSPFWPVVTEAWDRLLAVVPQPATGFVTALSQLTQRGLFGTSSRDMLRFEWQRVFEDLLRERGLLARDYFFSDPVEPSTIPVTPLVRAYARSSHSLTEIQDLFLSRYVFLRPEAQGLPKSASVTDFESTLSRLESTGETEGDTEDE